MHNRIAFSAAVREKVRAYDASSGAGGRYLPERYDHEAIFYRSTGATGRRAQSPGRMAWFFDTEALPPANLVHELGHTLGLPHASQWIPTTSDPIGPGSRGEYGNEADTMARGLAFNYSALHYGAWYKAFLGWIPPEDILALRPAPGVQEIRLYRHDHAAAAGTRLVTIARNGTQEYTLEYRAGHFTNPQRANAVLLGRGRRIGPYLDHHELIDTTPLSAERLTIFDGALALGRTFSDLALNLHLTPLRVGGEGARSYVDLSVYLGAPTTGNRQPVATVRGGTTVVQPGSPFSFAVEVLVGRIRSIEARFTFAGQGRLRPYAVLRCEVHSCSCARNLPHPRLLKI